MNLTTFKTKLLLFLSTSNREEGKTKIIIIVLFVVILCLCGIAIALPYFLSESAKAHYNEGKAYLRAIVRAQHAYRLEHPSFASNFTDLKIGLPTQTANYIFKITSADENSTTVEAISLDYSAQRSFAGQVITNKKIGTKAMICQTTETSNKPPIPDAANQKCITGEPMNYP